MAPDGEVDAGSTEYAESAASPARTLLVDLRLVSILLLSGVGLLSSQLIPPALPAIQSGLTVSDSRIGLVLTALFVPSIVLIPVVGGICDIYGRRQVAVASLGGFGAAGVAMFFAPSFEAILALRVVQGVCFAALTPLSVAFIGDVFQGQDATTAQGLRASTNGLVSIVVPAAAGVLADIAWNYPFLLYAAAFPAMIVVYRHFPEPDAFGAGPQRSIRREFSEWASGVSESLYDRGLLLLILGGSLLFMVRSVVITIAPLLGTQTIDLRPSTVGLLFSVIGVVRVVVSPFAGRFATWLSRKTVFLVTLTVVVASMGVTAVASSLPELVAGIVTYSFGVSLFLPTLNDTVTDSAPTENRAGVVSALQTTKIVANTVAPALAGVLLALTDFRTVFIVTGAILFGYVVALAVTLDPDAY